MARIIISRFIRLCRLKFAKNQQFFYLLNITTEMTTIGVPIIESSIANTVISGQDGKVLKMEAGAPVFGDVGEPPVSWSLMGSEIEGEDIGDEAGYSISMSADGTIVAIGAARNDGGGSSSGHVRVYEYDGSTWSQVGLDIDGSAGSWLGWSCSLSADGTILAVGGPFNSDAFSSAGQVQVYEFTGGTWSQIGADLNGTAAFDRFGTSVSLSADGTILAVGARQNNNPGFAEIYENIAGTWTLLGSRINGDANDDYFGVSISLSADGTIVAIGAQYNSAGGVLAGQGKIYEYSASTWTQLGSDILGDAAGDLAGVSVSLSADGTIFAIGAMENDGNGTSSGHVMIFEYSASTWSQVGTDIDGTNAGDESGISVSLSGDGKIVAIGAHAHGSAVDGLENGQVRVYEFDGVDWVQTGDDIIGDTGDEYGYSVSMSKDGTRFAAGGREIGLGGGSQMYELTKSTARSELNLTRSKEVETVTASSTIERKNGLMVIQTTTSGITTDLWAYPKAGDNLSILNKSGGSNTVDGNENNIDGTATISLADDASVNLIYDGTEWFSF